MPMTRAIRLLNSVEAGTTDSSALETLLADAGRRAEWTALMDMPGQARRAMASLSVMSTIAASPRACAALMASNAARSLFYGAGNDYLRAFAPNAWAVYSPQRDSFALNSATLEVAKWRNALGLTTRDMTSASSSVAPLLSTNASPLPGAAVPLFDGSNDTLVCGETFNQAAAWTIFVVYRLAAVTNHVLVGVPVNAANTGGVGVNSSGAATSCSGGNNSTTAFSNNGGAQSTWALSRFRRVGSDSYHSLNGGADSSSNATVTPLTGGSLNIGSGRQNSGTQYLSGSVAEVWLLAGNGDASTPEVQRITALLKNKYGL